MNYLSAGWALGVGWAPWLVGGHWVNYLSMFLAIPDRSPKASQKPLLFMTKGFLWPLFIPFPSDPLGWNSRFHARCRRTCAMPAT